MNTLGLFDAFARSGFFLGGLLLGRSSFDRLGRFCRSLSGNFRRRKKFMAHDELGARIGDKVRIVETRPLSARKRWRVVEIIQKAEI